MIYLFGVMIPYLLGRGTLRALYGKTKGSNLTLADAMLTGGMVIIGLAEAAHMGAVVLGRSFSDCKKMFLIGLIGLLVAAIVLLVIEKHGKEKDKATFKEAERLRVKKTLTRNEERFTNRLAAFGVGVLALVQLLLLVTEGRRYLDGDMTVEVVNTTLTTGAISQVNPMTGQAYTLGMPLRLKILCLPTLYAIFCDLFGMSAVSVVWTAVPVLVLLGSYGAFYAVAKALFPEEEDKRSVFMLLVALLLWVGGYMYGMDGFAVQYSGFRGVSIRMAILVPYTVSLVLRRKWKLVVLCILAEACIVWTLYGMGTCLLVAVGMATVGWLYGRFGKGGEEVPR